RDTRQFDNDVLPTFLRLQRWFAAKDRQISSMALTPLAVIDDGVHVLATVEVDTGDGAHQYLLPLSARWGEENVVFGAPKLSYTIARLRRGPQVGALVDGAYEEAFAEDLLAHLRKGATLPTSNGGLVTFRSGAGLAR